MHRSMARFTLSPLDLITSAALVLLLTFVWLLSLSSICKFWRLVLAQGIQLLALQAQIGVRECHITPYLTFFIPFPRIYSPFPDAHTWWLTLSAVCVVFATTLVMPEQWVPVKYLVRVILFLQATALVYFWLLPARFPVDPDSYMEGLVVYGTALISFIPVLFGLTYYIFDFGLTKKAFLTIGTMAYLCVFFPIQILFQAFLLHTAILFMPLLYIVLGLPMEVLIIVCFYSWGSSWAAKT